MWKGSGEKRGDRLLIGIPHANTLKQQNLSVWVHENERKQNETNSISTQKQKCLDEAPQP